MSITCNTFTLNQVYDLVNSGQYSYINKLNDPGTLWAWGYNNNGGLGDGTVISRSSPVQVPGTQWSQVSAGDRHTVATKSDGTLWTWGYNDFGNLGDGTVIAKSSPIQVPGTQWSQITGGLYHPVAKKV